MNKKYDYGSLKERIKAYDFTLLKLSNYIDMNIMTLSNKLNNKAVFKQNEIEMICHILQIDDVKKYFFTEMEEVRKGVNEINGK